jgi:hypothetical protein
MPIEYRPLSLAYVLTLTELDDAESRDTLYER